MDQLRGWEHTTVKHQTHKGNNEEAGHSPISNGRFFHVQTNSQVIKRFDYSSQVSRENLQNYLEFVYN